MSRLALAVDFGGTKVEAALVDADGIILPHSRARAATGSTASSHKLEAAVRSVIGQALSAIPVTDVLIGIGIGSAGPIGLSKGVISPVNLPVWRNFPLRDTVESASRAAGHDHPAVLRLDGLCITAAEAWRGAAQGRDTVLGMVVSTGIGGGLLAHGRIISGASGNAGHIGQMEVAGFSLRDEACTLEGIASGPNTVAWANSRGWTGRTGEDLAVAYADGHPVARNAVERSAGAVGRTIASVTTLLDLDCVVIGGGFIQVTADYIDLVRAAVAKYAPFAYSSGVSVFPAGLGENSPLVGAAALVHLDLTGPAAAKRFGQRVRSAAMG